MSLHVVQLLSHSVEAYDMLRLYQGLGVEVFDVGGYINPAEPHVDIRPALPEVPFFQDLKAAVDDLGTPDNLTAAQNRLPDALLDWADVIVAHHYLERVFGDWPRLRQWLRDDSGRRIIWRSVGQSVEYNERQAQPFRDDGLERVAYSPKEANIPGYSGHDALIRFYKDPADFLPWNGDREHVVNFTQQLAQRDPYTNWRFWEFATTGLPHHAYGPGSEEIGGGGNCTYPDMLRILQGARAYLYTGTQPASYTLGLLESLMAGVPVVSIGPGWMNVFPYGPGLFEGHELAQLWSDDPHKAFQMLAYILENRDYAQHLSEIGRAKAIDLFGWETIAAQWAQFLGIKVAVAA